MRAPGLNVVKRLGKATKARKTYLISGLNPRTGFRAYNSTIVGMERGILERLYFICEDGVWTEPPVPVNGTINRRLERFATLLDNLAHRRHPLEHMEFAMCYHGPRRARYIKAAESLKNKSVCKKDAEVGYFLKFEFYDFECKNNPSPRGISPRDDRYLCSAGAYLHPIEPEIYKNIETVFGYPVVLKGYNQEGRGRLIARYWSEIADPVAISIDASRFEQSVGTDALNWEHSRYKRFYKGDKLFAKLMRWQIKNRGRARTPDGHLSFEIEGRRMSGDKNTALGNCLLSSALGYAFMEHVGIGIAFYRLFCDGDDAVMIISKKHLKLVMATLTPWYREMGFRMKVETPAYMLEHIDFCQSRPIWTPQGYLMVREPHKALSKDSMSKKPLDSRKNYQRWIASVGQGGVAMTGGIPCMQAYYHCLVKGSEGAQPLKGDPSLTDFFQYKVQGMDRKLTDIHPKTRSSFSLAFGVSPRAQTCIEQYYNTLRLEYGSGDSVLAPFAKVW